jgi:hypothetical protein
MKRIIIAGVAVAALATCVSTASAMPVRDLTTETYGYNVEVAATAYSPPAGACGAYYGIRIYRGGTLLRQRVGRFNACQKVFDDDWSYGTFRATFGVRSLPVGTYRVCAGAGNTAYVGGIHAICRYRRF